MDDFERFKTFVVEPAREPELEVEPEDATEFLQAMEEPGRLQSMGSQRVRHN